MHRSKLVFHFTLFQMAPNWLVRSGVSRHVPEDDSTATEPGGCAKSEDDVVIAQAPPEIALLAPLDEMDPTVSLTSFRSKIPAPVTETADKFGIEPAPERRSVPAEIVVELV